MVWVYWKPGGSRPSAIRWLAWRFQLAAKELASGSEKVASIGARVGYESEAAFGRAFKRATAQAPATWRHARQHGQASA